MEAVEAAEKVERAEEAGSSGRGLTTQCAVGTGI